MFIRVWSVHPVANANLVGAFGLGLVRLTSSMVCTGSCRTEMNEALVPLAGLPSVAWAFDLEAPPPIFRVLLQPRHVNQGETPSNKR